MSPSKLPSSDESSTPNTSLSKTTPPEHQFPIVGVGASAGGLEALKKFFEPLPPDTGMAFVVIQHLDPKANSHLPELLGAVAKMPVAAVTEGLNVAPNKVYIIPPNKFITLSENTLHLIPRPEGQPGHLPLNAFLTSLAAARQHLSIGIILSGTGSDGTLGVGEIKAVGGITFAQDEKSAQFPGMPQSAVQSGQVDFVLPPAEIARELTRIGTNPLLLKVPIAEDESIPIAEVTPDQQFRAVLGILHTQTNVDFGHYRVSTLQRRILRRMVIRKIDSLAQYIELLDDDPSEAQSLFFDLLINVTSFFRDPEMYDALKTKVLPELVEGKRANDPFRLWVVGCSTGQEAYSYAISLLEYLEPLKKKLSIQIFASDISDPHALNVARAGWYPESINAEVSSERLHRYFVREDGGFRINKSIRDMCVFARQNVIADPPFSRLDLVSCRNVLIYLSTEMQKRLIPLFHYSLNYPGFLLLGSAETIGTYTDLFSVVDKKLRIFARKPAHTRNLPPFRVAPFPVRQLRDHSPPGEETAPKGDAQVEVDRLLLQRYAPGAVLVNSDLDVLQFRGRTSPWLEPPRGEARLSIGHMARQSLFLEIRQGVKEAHETARRVRKENVRGGESPADRVNLEITPIRPRQGAIESFLVIFEPVDGQLDGKPAAPAPEVPAEQELRELRSELAAAHEYVQSIIEQQDASTEELRSANEEILSANEELQSSNEELETAKEELQSTNEELTTLNEELQTRNYELAQITDDLLNLLSSTRLPILMITSEMLIRRFTPGATKAFNLLSSDIGRPLNDIRPSFDLPDLIPLIRNVISDVAPIEREVLDRNRKWHLLRIHPYRTTDNRIDGAVLMLLDIHAAKTAAEKLKAAADYTSAIVEYLLDPLLLLDDQLNIESANKAYCEMVACDAADLVGRPFHKVHGGMWNLPELRDKMARVVDRGATIEDYLVEKQFDGCGRKTISVRARLLREQVGKPRVIVVLTDITSLHDAAIRSDAERTARMEAEQANRIKDQFLAMLSHELRNPLNAVLGWTKVLKSGKKVGPAELAEGFERIEAAAQTQVRMISDLLDISRIAAGKMELELSPVDLPSLLDCAVEMFVPAAQAKEIQLVRHYKPVAGGILADPERLRQVMSNLLSNAVKFTPPGGKIEVELRGVEHCAQITVRDSGPGIDPEFQKFLFERFRQAEMPGTKKFAGGLGLGLAIVKHLVTLHGGTVRAQSNGKGAEFIVSIPYSDINVEVLARPQTKTSTKPLELPDLAGLRVLLVDDDPDACAIAQRIFEEHEIKVFIALSAREGLEVLRHEHPDIIVSDIGMPDQDGYELMRQIRLLPAKKGGNTPAIALTAFARPEDRKQALAVGYQKHLAKPVDPLELLTVIATLTSENRKGKPERPN